MTLPLILGTEGATPTPVNTLRTALIDGVSATNPGYTANLPGSLIEDIVSTDVGALAVIDQARVDAVNNITPYAMNAYLLIQMGKMLGISQGIGSNASVLVVITGAPGYIIQSGFIVSDGTNQFIIQSGGAIQSGGSTDSLYAVASQPGSFAIPANTVTTIVSSASVPLTVTNPNSGTSSTSDETVDDYRARIIEANQAVSKGTGNFIRTQLKKVSGVVPRLVSVRQAINGWKVICGGGDPYDVAYAIYSSMLDISALIGSATASRNVTASISDDPDVYDIKYISPPMQTVLLSVIWNTSTLNFTNGTQVNQLSAVALQAYINSITVGSPINTFEMTNIFQTAVADVISAHQITTLLFTVTIDGLVVPPQTGTGIIAGDSESYLSAADTAVTVAQG